MKNERYFALMCDSHNGGSQLVMIWEDDAGQTWIDHSFSFSLEFEGALRIDGTVDEKVREYQWLTVCWEEFKP